MDVVTREDVLLRRSNITHMCQSMPRSHDTCESMTLKDRLYKRETTCALVSAGTCACRQKGTWKVRPACAACACLHVFMHLCAEAPAHAHVKGTGTCARQLAGTDCVCVYANFVSPVCPSALLACTNPSHSHTCFASTTESARVQAAIRDCPSMLASEDDTMECSVLCRGGEAVW